jgi:hydrogenase maturation protease
VPRPRVLILAWGNPSRGDDALGPRLIERLEGTGDVVAALGVELLTDFQLQIEHALDLAERDLVVFADAAASGAAPFAFDPVASNPALPISTHALSPGAVLSVYRRVLGGPEPRCYQLAIRGYDFELGRDLSPAASTNLDAALAYLLDWLARVRGEPCLQ